MWYFDILIKLTQNNNIKLKPYFGWNDKLSNYICKKFEIGFCGKKNVNFHLSHITRKYTMI